MPIHWRKSLVSVTGVMVLLVIGREGIPRRLDAWTYSEIADQQQVLAAAAAAFGEGRQDDLSLRSTRRDKVRLVDAVGRMRR